MNNEKDSLIILSRMKFSVLIGRYYNMPLSFDEQVDLRKKALLSKNVQDNVEIKVLEILTDPEKVKHNDYIDAVVQLEFETSDIFDDLTVAYTIFKYLDFDVNAGQVAFISDVHE